MQEFMSPHGDSDHMGETIILVENFKAERVIINCSEYNNLKQSKIYGADENEIKES